MEIPNRRKKIIYFYIVPTVDPISITSYCSVYVCVKLYRKTTLSSSSIDVCHQYESKYVCTYTRNQDNDPLLTSEGNIQNLKNGFLTQRSKKKNKNCGKHT